ncbi:universal stress protein [Nesterenkonia ebinurensis]|uniref:universal stress protein n=1 Tax=Nesterenkonia ebinurensis TaxID=2608252 RepID=UPI00123D4572|nr:universal stress protein [Nesterenkonia ebinurensis]
MTSTTRNQGSGTVSSGKRHGVVVGVDGSDHSIGALRLAAEEAGYRDVPLTLIASYAVTGYAIAAADLSPQIIDENIIRRELEELLENACEHIDTFDGQIRTEVERGDAVNVLLDYSRNAELVVVGSRGRGGFTGLLLGSTSARLPAHSKAPVLVVPRRFTQAALAPGASPLDSNAPIAAGVDGSSQSLLAALEAARLAIEREVGLKLVSALPPVEPDVSWTPLQEQRRRAFDHIRQRCEQDANWLQELYPGLELQSEIEEGRAAEILIAETGKAQVTVVGTRGRGGFSGMLLGSTSNATMHHAAGPVMVVPAYETDLLGKHPRFTEK